MAATSASRHTRASARTVAVTRAPPGSDPSRSSLLNIQPHSQTHQPSPLPTSPCTTSLPGQQLQGVGVNPFGHVLVCMGVGLRRSVSAHCMWIPESMFSLCSRPHPIRTSLTRCLIADSTHRKTARMSQEARGDESVLLQATVRKSTPKVGVSRLPRREGSQGGDED